MAEIEKIQSVLERIRPALQADGGDLELVDVTDGLVRVRLKGICPDCTNSTMMLKSGIERILKQQVPGVSGLKIV